MIRRILFCFTLLFASLLASAQESRGTLSGLVTDSSGAIVPKASVQIINIQTGSQIDVFTNDSGVFTAPFLLPSVYRVTITHDGFKALTRDNVEVQVGAKVQLDCVLPLGNITQTVDVSAAPPLLETGSASLGLVVATRDIQGVPMASGNVAELAVLAPGVSSGSSIAVHKAAYNSGTSSITTDGNSINANEWTIDGIPNMFASGSSPRIAFSPPPMTISEFKVMTTFYDASMGHTSGGIINMNTQSGTSQFHGELHEFLGNSALNANGYFANLNHQAKQVYQDNRYGAAIGGPVILPRLYHGDKRTFFYYAFEGNKWGSPQSFTGTVPTTAERNGDFSALLALGSAYAIYDPSTTALQSNGLYTRTAFPNNIIPQSRLDNTALKLLQLYPQPNAAGTTGGINNYVLANVTAKENYYAHFVRLDHSFSDRSRMFFRLDYDKWDEKENAFYGTTNPATGHHDGRTNRGLALDEVYTLNSSNVLDFRYGLTAQEFPGSPLVTGINLSSYGFSSGFTSLFPSQTAVLPSMTFSTFSELGSNPSEVSDANNTSLIHSFSGSVTSLIKSHTLHYGIDARINRANQRPYNNVQGVMTFDSTYTNGPVSTASASPVGQDFAAFLLGLPGGSIIHYSSYADQDVWFGGYLQDDWRVTPKLTLNLGFRLEHESPVTDRYDRAVIGFDSTTTNPISTAAIANYAASPMPDLPASNFKVVGGLKFAGGSNGRGFWNGPTVEAMPRLAFAYQASSKTVVRGGYGLFYDTIGVYRSPAIQTGYSSTTPVLASNDNGLTYQASLDNPVPNGLITPLGAGGGLTTALGQALTVYNSNRSIAYAERWSLNIQHEFGGGFLLDASYVGNHGVHLPISQSIDNTPASYLSTSPVRDNTTNNYLNASYPNPFYGLASSYTKTTTRAQLLKPYPQFTSVTETSDIGSSHYDALQLQLQKRFSYGYSLNVAYTHSKLLDAISYLNPTDPQPWYGVSQYDRPNRITVSSLWELPFGRGKLVGTNMPRWANVLAGGWQWNTIVTYQSGDALTWGNVLFTGDVADIPLHGSQRNINHWFNTSGFVTASSQQLVSNIRTFPLRLGTVRGDGQYLWNFAAIKEFSFIDRLRFQLRGEAYNAFNHPNMSDPSLTVTSSSFGTVTAQDGYGREIQIAARILF